VAQLIRIVSPEFSHTRILKCPKFSTVRPNGYDAQPDHQAKREAHLAKKSLSRNLSRKELEADDYHATLLEIYGGSDRVAAIMSGALVEDSLAKVISAYLTDSRDQAALFYDQGAPFGTFKARIVAGKAMGLFSASVAEDMDIIRDIRNQFAHALLSIDFLNPHIVAACERMNSKVGLGGIAPNPRPISPARRHYEKVTWDISKQLRRKAVDLLKEHLRRLKLPDEEIASLQSDPNDVLGDIDPV
jgi:hypothetical protein